MQNDLKYGELSEICGLNGYFMGKNRKKSRLQRQTLFPYREGNSHILLRGGKNSNFCKNILP